MMKTVFGKGALLSAMVSVSGFSWGASISGEIIFDKKPPHAGVVYVLSRHKEVVKPAEIDQKDKQFTRTVIPVSKDQKVTFKNSDNMDHNIYAQDRKSGVKFDVGLMSSGQSTSIDVSWDNPTFLRIGCKIHPKMRAYIAKIPSNHFQEIAFRKSKPPYNYVIDNLEKDSAKVVFEMPGYDSITLDYSANINKEVPIIRKGKTVGKFIVKGK